MMKLALACGLAVTLMACASNPQNSTAATTPAAAPAAAPAAGTAATTAQATPSKPKLVCEEQKPLGSLLPQRICMTPEEAAARKKAAQDRIQQMQEQSASGPGMSSSSGG